MGTLPTLASIRKEQSPLLAKALLSLIIRTTTPVSVTKCERIRSMTRMLGEWGVEEKGLKYRLALWSWETSLFLI